MNLSEAFIDEMSKTAEEEKKIPLGWQLAHHVAAPVAVGLGVGALQHPFDKLLNRVFKSKTPVGPYRFSMGSAIPGSVGAFIGSLLSRGTLRRSLAERDKRLEKKAVWKAPGQTSLSQSLPGKIPKSRLGRLFGDPSTKVRGDYAKMLREQRGGPGEESARHLLAVARAHAAGRSGVEGFEGQQKIEKAKLLARDAKDAAMRESDNTVVGRFLNALNPFKEKKRKHYGSRVFEPEKGVRFAPRSSESIKGKKSSAAAEMLAAPFMLLHPPIKG